MPLEETVPPLAVQFTLVLLVPLTVAANCWLVPICSEVAVGEMATLMPTEGELVGAVTVNRMALDFFPFSVLTMSTEFFPAWAMSVAEMVTVALVALTTVVGRREPFHSTTHAPEKLYPLTCMLKPALPAVACAGESALRTGVPVLFVGGLDGTVLVGIMGRSARERDTTNVRKTNKTHHFVTGDSPKSLGSYAGIGLL